LLAERGREECCQDLLQSVVRLCGKTTAIGTPHISKLHERLTAVDKASDHRPYHDNFFTPTQLIHFRRQYRQHV